MPRLFVAVDVPRSIRSALVAIQRSIERVRWVREEQLHLTVRFIGDSDEETFERIRAALRDRIQGTFDRFELSLAGVGQFPKNRRAQVIWAGVKPIDALVALSERVEEALSGLGPAREDRAFSPHITLARLKGASPIFVRRFVEDHQELASDPFMIEEVQLYSSILSSKGSTYHVEERLRLA